MVRKRYRDKLVIVTEKRGEIEDNGNTWIDATRGISISKIKSLSRTEKLNLISILKREVEQPSEPELPISIFKYDLSALRTIVKYLKENLSLENQKIADLLNRDYKTICSTYNEAKKEMPKPLKIEESQLFIPLSIFTNRKFSVLESLVSYLKETHGLKYKEIAKLLNLNYKTITTVANRASKKRKK